MRNKLSSNSFHNTDFEREFDEWLQGQEDGTLDSKDIEVDDYPIVCSKAPIGSYFAVLDENGMARFAGMNVRKAWKQPEVKKMFSKQAVFDIFHFIFPSATKQLRKQHQMVSQLEYRHAETIIDLRSTQLAANHPLNNIFYSHMMPLSYNCAMHAYRAKLCNELCKGSWTEQQDLHEMVKGWLKEGLNIDDFRGREGWVAWEWSVASPMDTKMWGSKPRAEALRSIRKHFPEAEAVVR